MSELYRYSDIISRSRYCHDDNLLLDSLGGSEGRTSSFEDYHVYAGRTITRFGWELDIAKYYHDEYVIGEEVYHDGGLRYVKTGKLTSEDVE